MNLKKLVKVLVSAVLSSALLMTTCSASVLPSAAAKEKSLKILAIGNSFSEDALSHLYQIAKDCGATEVVLGNLIIGGCSLSIHRSNAQNNTAAYTYQKNTTGTWSQKGNVTMLEGIKDEDWDVITLQQVSSFSGIASTYNEDIDYLVNYIRANKTNANLRLGWQMTWAYQMNSGHPDFPKYNNDQMTMYKAITDAVQEHIVTNDAFDFIIPSGTAVQNARSSFLGDTLTRDGFHLSLHLGRYIAGLTWLRAITGWSIDDVTYVPSVSEVPAEYLPMIKEAVNQAISTPFSVTPSSYTQNPAEDTSLYQQLDWSPAVLGYWNSFDGAYTDTPLLSTDAGNSKNFVASQKRFTKNDIPVGSIIEIDAGYQYRPDGWTYKGQAAPGRPENVTAARFVVNEAWWAKYEYRSFNITAIGGSQDYTGKVEETAAHLRIYIPKSNEKEIKSFQIGDFKSTITGNAITVRVPADTDVTALKPSITVSDSATVTPASGVAQDFSQPVIYTVRAENGLEQVYVVTVEKKIAYDYSGYKLLDWEPTLGYWNSVNGGYAASAPLYTTADNSKYYVSSGKRFTKEDIPVGSVIEIDPGYQYRPDGWVYEGYAFPGRPENVTTERIVVDEAWWANYEYRAFNVAVAGNNADLTEKVAETASHFRIYIPKLDGNDILDFSINGVKGVIDESSIAVRLPAGTELTALNPTLSVSEGATFTPVSGPVDFTKAVTYTVTAENGDVRQYTVTVTLENKADDKEPEKPDDEKPVTGYSAVIPLLGMVSVAAGCAMVFAGKKQRFR